MPAIEPERSDGAPRAVTVTTTPDGRISRVDDAPGELRSESPAAETPPPVKEESSSRRAKEEASAGAATLKTPSLTPWELTPEPEKKPAPKAAQKEQPKAVKKTPEPEKLVAEQRLRTAEIAPSADDTLPETAVHKLKNITMQFAGNNLKLRIVADNAFPCKSFVLTGPDRLVIDLPGKWSGMTLPRVPQNSLVKNARLGRQPAGPRLVLDLARALKGHTVQRSANVVEVLLQQ
jgi:hypothetical protein